MKIGSLIEQVNNSASVCVIWLLCCDETDDRQQSQTQQKIQKILFSFLTGMFLKIDLSVELSKSVNSVDPLTKMYANSQVHKAQLAVTFKVRKIENKNYTLTINNCMKSI
jgi:hypothetical protein